MTAQLLRPLALHLKSMGIDVAGWRRDVGIEAPVAGDPRLSRLSSLSRLSHEALLYAWTRAIELTGDARVGLSAAAATDFRMLNLGTRATEYVVLHAYANSPDVASGLARFARYLPTAHTDAHAALSRGAEDSLRLSLRVGEATSVRSDALMEYWVGLVAKLVAATTIPPVLPVEVWFAHPAPADTALYARVFGRAALRFGADGDGLAFTAESARRSLRTTDRVLLEIAERHAGQALDAQSAGASMLARVRDLVAGELRRGSPTSTTVAARLGVSVRTLARRLAAEGVTFKDLLDEVRMHRAEEYLRDARLTLGEVSTMLGFADPSAFARAYKRWFGAAPGERRARPPGGAG